jgi:hypothetical protein
MQKMTKEKVKQLQNQTSRVLTVEDFDLIEKLDRAAVEVSTVTKREYRLLNQPFNLCGVNFYPLTVAKSMWIEEKCCEWELDDASRSGFLLWSLTLENTEAALDAFTTRRQADKASKRLLRKLHCREAELTDIYEKCTGQTADSVDVEDDGEDLDYGGMVAVLLREFGGSPEKWLYETPIEMLGVLFTAYEERVIRESEASADVSASKGKAVAPRPSKRLAALSRFRKASEHILEAWSEE